MQALCAEISNFKFQTPSRVVDTVYFGGGTPSLLTAQQVERILRTVFDNFAVAANAEITLEINPATLTLEKAGDFKRLGINRASFGAQTFDDAELRKLGRKHSARDVRETIEILRHADFDNVSFDLIAGLPNQTLHDWRRNLTEAFKLKPEHLSLYLLEVHEATPLARHIEEGKQPAPDEDSAAEMYEILLEQIAANGYRQYEISNFCLPGFESRHNSKYWTMDAVIGFGCAAHSFDGANRRWANERDTKKYIDLIEREQTAVVEQTEIDAVSEAAFLGLRLTRGVDLNEYKRRFAVDLLEKYKPDLAVLFDAGLLEVVDDNLRLTAKGALFSNEVFAVFV